ncbi:MAG: hypothetical protein HYZ09_00095 [Candidatus Kerfeldbacteria bacterium]|nr:hypothetical protein [Candidatus Kerfeldbacteria bacterium]
MLGRYPHETQARIDSAKEALRKMESAQDGFVFGAELRNFLESANYCFHPMQKQNARRTQGFDAWRQEQANFMIGRQGITKYITHQGVIRAIPYPDVPLEGFQWEFDTKPEGYENVLSIDIAHKYLELLESILNAFIERFVKS